MPSPAPVHLLDETADLHVHEPFELAFTGPANGVVDVTPVTVRFTAGAGDSARDVVSVPGFWDGDDRYAVRFNPSVAGTWTWTSESPLAELDGLTGAVEVAPARTSGGVSVADTFHFAHADGTPFRPVGGTAYSFLHQPDELVNETIDALAEAHFNKFRFMVFPQAGGFAEHVPAHLPFEKDADGAWDVTRPNVTFFRRLDDVVRRLGERGVQADVLIFNAYDYGHYGLDKLTEEQDAIYLRYVVARLSAFSNVWWSLCNEFDVLVDRPRDRWDRAGALLAEIDPHDRLRSIHNWMELFDQNRPWITHASIQNGSATTEFGRASLYRDAFVKPIVLDEIKYEGDIPDRWGNLSGEQLVHQFWITTVAGCYASHGESFVKSTGSLHMVEGGAFEGTSPARLGFLRRVLDELVVPGLDPIDKWDDAAYVAGWPRRQYVQYLGLSAPESWTFRLPQGNTGEKLEVGDRFKVEIIDTWNMTVTPVDRVFTLTDVRRNDAFATDEAAVELPAGEALALRITRVA